MPCETFTSTGASPAFDTTTQELGVTVAPSYSSEFYASTLEVCARVNYSGPLGFVKVQLAAGGSLRTRTLLDVTIDSKASLTAPAAQEAALHILRRRSLAAPVRPAPVLDTRFVASEPARPTVLH